MKRGLGILFLLALALAGSLTLTGPTWSPTTAFTNNTLTCTWTASGDTLAQNITLLRNGALFNTTYENASLVTLSTSLAVPSSNTTKGDIWTCRITLANETTTAQQDVNVTILNSPPVLRGLPAGIFNSSLAEVGDVIQVFEDATSTYDANATDADDDTITYSLLSAQFCSVVSDTLGTYACTPTQAYITNNTPTLKNISFAAADASGGVFRFVTFNITPVNDAPVVTTSNQTTAVNASKNMTFSASDEESSFALTYALIFNGSNNETQDKLTIAKLDPNGTSVSVYYDASMPDFNDVGLWPIFINVTDNSTDNYAQNDSRSAIYTFNLNITASGRRPYFTNVTSNLSSGSGPYNLTQGQSISINITANDPDANSTITFLDNTSYFVTSTVKADTNTSDASGQINYTALNAHVGTLSATITIVDGETLTNTTIILFNITNVNDAPSVEEISASAANTQNNTNASNLTAYANSAFLYDVNATDPDSIHGDTLNYTDNASLFDINLTTGRIAFTPSDAETGTYDINVTVTDVAGLQGSRVLRLAILANSPPYFNQTLSTLACSATAACTRDLGEYADDPDIGDAVAAYNVTLASGNLSSLAFNATTGVIDFTPTKSEVGNHTVNVTITDMFGATNSSLMNITVNNTPFEPNFTRYDFSAETIVETHLFAFELRATDDDFLVPGVSETVNFTTNLSISYQLTPLARQNTTARALLSFTPTVGEAGNYTIRINATDSFGLVNSTTVSFEVLPQIPPPNITNITPWGVAPDYAIRTTFNSTSLFAGNGVTVNASENATITFAAIVNDSRPLTYNWTVNGTQNATNVTNITLNYGWFSSGTYTIVLNVTNDRLESARWTWTFVVNNLNRPPILSDPLPNRSINTTETVTDYFLGPNNAVRFYDPDDDLDGNGYLDSNETNGMTFSTVSSCEFATIAISGASLVLTPLEIGDCNVYFNATDADGLTVESGLVVINVTDVPEGETTTTVSSSGGGGSVTSNFIPLNNENDKPEAFHLIAPKLVTIYENNSIVIPIVINNTWKGPLQFVQVWAEANVTGVETSFDQDLFEEIPENQSREVMLTVTNYRLGENYEVLVRANVSDPEYEDEALILLNSLEQASAGEQARVKVTFANDLLNQHPECQELNEVLDKAKQSLSARDVDEANRLVDSVINGCRYLVSTQQKVTERPSYISPLITIDSLSLKVIMWSVLAFALLVSVALLAYYHYSSKSEDDF